MPIRISMWLLTMASAIVGLRVAAAKQTQATAQKEIKLAFITCCVDQAFFVPVKKGMHDAAKMLEVECDFLGTPGVDFAAQVKLAQQAIRDGYDGLAFNLIDDDAFDEVVAEAIAKGIPVVAFNVDDSKGDNARLAAVSQKFYAAGKTVAERAAKDLPSGAHVLLTKHDDNVSALEERLRGIQSVLKDKGIRSTTVMTGNKAEEGEAVVTKSLQENPDIRVVLSSGQADTEAAGRAIESHFAGKQYFAAGFDLSPKTLELIQAGHISFVVDQQPYVQGFYPVLALTLKLRYGIEPSDIDAGAGIVDSTNVNQIIELTAQGYR